MKSRDRFSRLVYVVSARISTSAVTPHEDPPWYATAVIYEVHVRAFRDSDGNGSGDFIGLTSKLDYLQDLGISAIWLLPFCPSPGRDDGYDISDYLGIHPAYGCLDDFKQFLDECKRRELGVITELVLNHTSDQHPWFERARNSPAGSRWRDFYVWSDTPDRYADARVIFKDFESSNWSWDPVANSWYWHRFFSHQPDLNFDNPEVRQAAFDTLDFWFGMGVDGLRLDAVPYLFEREGTSCENLPETHAFLKELRGFIDSRYPGRMLLAEANQWPEDAVAYFGDGDECHMAFNFPLMPRLFMANRMEDSFPVSNIIRQTPEPPAGCYWATFLRNHDELTLEMVCEEERDYMYRVYAKDPEMRVNVGIRRRLAPLLGNDPRRIRLMNGLLFSLPGTPVIYYGDEIGMGEDLTLGDRNSVRTPMQWTAGHHGGFSDASPENLYLPVITEGEYGHRFVNVESQLQNRNSLLWWMRHALAVRRDSLALTSGTTHLAAHSNRHVLAFLRTCGTEVVLVVANLSRHAQPVRLKLTEFVGRVPVEAFGRVEFPPITTEPYQLSVEPYGFYWFRLRRSAKNTIGAVPDQQHTVENLDHLLSWDNRRELGDVLLSYVQRSHSGAMQVPTQVEVTDLLNVAPRNAIAVFRVSFTGGDAELRVLPLSLSSGLSETAGLRTVANLIDTRGTKETLSVDLSSAGAVLLPTVSGQSDLEGQTGTLRGIPFEPVMPGFAYDKACLVPNAPRDRMQRNTSVLLGGLYVLKLYRRLERGENPELEILRFLFEKACWTHVPPVFARLVYRCSDGDVFDAGMLQALVENRTDLWQLTVEEVYAYLERMAARPKNSAQLSTPELLLESYMAVVELLGKRTGELHVALSTAKEPAIAPEPFDGFYVRGAAHLMTSRAALVRNELESRFPLCPSEARNTLRLALDRLAELDTLFSRITEFADLGLRIRVHGDLHLGQVLGTGDDVVFIDFEGDNSRPLSERRLKMSPLVDVAGMLYSFRYAAATVRDKAVREVFPWKRRAPELTQWTQRWYEAVSSAYTDRYLVTVAGHRLVPETVTVSADLLDIYLAAKAVYQLGYELAHREEWIPVAAATLLEVTDRMIQYAAPSGTVQLQDVQ